MPIEFFDYASVFLNSMCLLVGGIACAYLSMSTFFVRRHSLYLFFGYFLLKMFTVAATDTVRWFHSDAVMLIAVGEVLVAFFGVTVIAVTYYTWDGSLAKVGLMGILTDFIASFALMGAVAFSNTVFGTGPVLEYVGYLHPAAAISGCLMVVFFIPLLQIAKPLGRSIVNYSFKHEGPVLFFVFGNIVFSAVTRLSGFRDGLLSDFTSPFLVMCFCVPLLVAYLMLRAREARRRRLYLARSRSLMSACNDAIRSQSEFLERSRDTLDSLALRIERIENDVVRDDFRRYLDGLQSICDSLRFGTYSDNPVLDTVLIRYEDRFKSAGVKVSYRISPLATSGQQVAIAAQELLDWAVRLMSSAANVDGAYEVQFRAFRRANQLFLELGVPQGHPAVTRRRWRARRLLSGATVVRAQREKDMFSVCLMLEEAVA